VLGVVVLVAGWLTVTALRARADLNRAQTSLENARTAAVDERLGVATVAVSSAQAQTSDARRLTSDPVWRAVTRIPFVGRTPRAVATATTQADRLTHSVLPSVLQVADRAAPDQLRTSGDTINLAPLVAAAPTLASARVAVADVQLRLSRTGHGFGVLPPVRHALNRLEAAVDSLAGTVNGASLAADLLPPMLGNNGPRRYLLAFQNPAESRGTGGLVGGYGILEADQGHLRVTTLGTDADLTSLPQVPAELGPDYVKLWGQDPALWVNSNESPDFSSGARIWLDAWRPRARPRGPLRPARGHRPGHAGER
jgi:Protein of unknown function (DUF4012)